MPTKIDWEALKSAERRLSKVFRREVDKLTDEDHKNRDLIHGLHQLSHSYRESHKLMRALEAFDHGMSPEEIETKFNIRLVHVSVEVVELPATPAPPVDKLDIN